MTYAYVEVLLGIFEEAGCQAPLTFKSLENIEHQVIVQVMWLLNGAV